PKEMVKESIEKAKKDKNLKKYMIKINEHHHNKKALITLTEAIQKAYDEGIDLGKIIVHALKRGWTKEDFDEILPKLNMIREDKSLIRQFLKEI
ncbi:MAG: hypothetical protein ABIJ08_03250, partial [Nanoarchaeota archaeon]